MGDGAAPSGYTAPEPPTPFGAVLGPCRRADNGEQINKSGAIHRRGLVGVSGRTEFGGTVLADSTAITFPGEARAGPADPGRVWIRRGKGVKRSSASVLEA
jgi:hypothetical protein